MSLEDNKVKNKGKTIGWLVLDKIAKDNKKPSREMSREMYLFERKFLESLGFDKENTSFSFPCIYIKDANFWDDAFFKKSIASISLMNQEAFEKSLQRNFNDTIDALEFVYGEKIILKSNNVKDIFTSNNIEEQKKLLDYSINGLKIFEETYKNLDKESSEKGNSHEQVLLTDKKVKVMDIRNNINTFLNSIYSISGEEIKNHIKDVSERVYGDRDYVNERFIVEDSLKGITHKILKMTERSPELKSRPKLN